MDNFVKSVRAVQEYCNGGSLRAAVNSGKFCAQRRFEGRWRLIVSLLRGVAAGMAHMHSKRLTHGDLNPANILLKARCRPTLFIFSRFLDFAVSLESNGAVQAPVVTYYGMQRVPRQTAPALCASPVL